MYSRIEIRDMHISFLSQQYLTGLALITILTFLDPLLVRTDQCGVVLTAKSSMLDIWKKDETVPLLPLTS